MRRTISSELDGRTGQLFVANEDHQVEWHGQSSRGVPWNVCQGRAEEQLERVPNGSVHCVVTSPPYYWLRDYGVDGQIGLEETVQDYINSLCNVFDGVQEALRSDGVLFLTLGDTYYSGKGKSHGTDRKSNKRRFGLRAVDKSGGLGLGLQRKSIIGVPWRVANELATRGWVLRSPIIWHRENCLPEAVADRPSRSYEYVFMFAKSRKYYFNKQPLIDQKVEEDMWTIPARPKSGNGLDTAPYPDELVARCLQIGCPAGGVVLDPFVGSGTTARVAVSTGHPAIGIDLNRDFCLYAVKQLRAL
ncbi:MAG: site-specific DNA-methyltransferase [Verrucomicrobiales bacterium]|nr:site-specific DNA-methyltransferase [Verrucomicrobiales bacterium]